MDMRDVQSWLYACDLESKTRTQVSQSTYNLFHYILNQIEVFHFQRPGQVSLERDVTKVIIADQDFAYKHFTHFIAVSVFISYLDVSVLVVRVPRGC